jgi:hypothetical protein
MRRAPEALQRNIAIWKKLPDRQTMVGNNAIERIGKGGSSLREALDP